jgi:ElaB/YqjD/DUF883 family membrane-anchored ribosome-binding protein
MADTNHPSSTVVPHSGAAAPLQTTAGEGAGTVIGEFVDAARSAAESLLNEQKREIADRVSGVAEALRSAVDPLQRSQNRVVARHVERAAGQVEGVSHTLRDRRWSELVADTEEFARRQPTWFVLGAVATGFLLGRFFWASAGSEPEPQHVDRASGGSESRVVTAAVASASGIGESAGQNTGAPGAVEGR